MPAALPVTEATASIIMHCYHYSDFKLDSV